MASNISLIVDTLKKNIPGLWGVYLFGSYANNTATQKSDVDLAVLAPDKQDVVKLYSASEALAVKLDKDIDLVDLRRVELSFGSHIIATGERIFCSNEYECESFEGLIFSMYIRLNEQRDDILKSIKSTGKIYGKRSN